MQCPRCGEANHDTDRFCSYCGHDLATYRRLWSAGTHAGSVTAPGGRVAPTAAAPTRATQGNVQSTLLSPAAPNDSDSPQVPSYLGWAAVLTALCWPAFWAAVPALLYAGHVETRLAAGDLVGAQRASRKAKVWCWVTATVGLAVWAAALALVAKL